MCNFEDSSKKRSFCHLKRVIQYKFCHITCNKRSNRNKKNGKNANKRGKITKLCKHLIKTLPTFNYYLCTL